ncbi:MAG TPA: hypothetical protein VHW46_15615 [Terracidiphilus sp.]|jgi:hypothetical protein|nr:hypothetical protein [Terracidiphilus sp.]
MNRTKCTVALLAAAMAIPALAAAGEPGHGQAIVTLMPKGKDTPTTNIQQQNVELKVAGKQSNITNFAPAKGPGSPLELVVLIDGSARSSLGNQLSEIAAFVKEMPANAKISIAYMQNGRAALTGPLSSDAAQVLNGLHIPGGAPGTSSSPYFCLSDLAKNWPSHDPSARREVLMITDGVDYYNLRFDPQDPYVQAAIEDSTRAGLVVYSFYWTNRGRVDQSAYENNAGQSLLSEVTQATGGNSYWEGTGNPVSFDSFFKDLRQRFQNQYRVNFSAELKGKPELERFSLKLQGADAKVYAPQQVLIGRAGPAAGE